MGLILDPYKFGLPDVAFVHSVTATQTASTSSVQTFNGMALSGARNAIFAIVCAPSGVNISGITIDGNPMTFGGRGTTGTAQRVEIWCILENGSGSVNAEVTFAGALGDSATAITLISVTGLQSVTPTASAVASSTNAPTLDVNISAGGIIIAGQQASSGTAVTPTGLTEDYDAVYDSPYLAWHGHALSATAQTPKACSLTGAGGFSSAVSVPYR